MDENLSMVDEWLSRRSKINSPEKSIENKNPEVTTFISGNMRPRGRPSENHRSESSRHELDAAIEGLEWYNSAMWGI